MIRSSLACVSALTLLTDLASAQQSDAHVLRPVSAAVRDGGTLHVATGTWTRRASSVSLGSDVLYDNTCRAYYVRPFGGDTIVDEGRLPSTTSPDNLTSKPGCAASYAIQGFQIAYCTDLPSATLTCSFYDEYFWCQQIIGETPVASFTLTGLPGSHGAASFCWTVNVDTAATPFVLTAGEVSLGSPELFGFAISSPQSSTVQGPLAAGDANYCSNFDGTSWDPTPDLAESGTGMGARDAYVVSGGPTAPGCYWFQGEPFASFWLELYGDTCAPDATGQEGYCYPGHGIAVACPCAPATSGDSGCRNSTGLGAILAGSGVARLSADSVVLAGSQMPPTSTVLYFQGTLRHNAGQGEVFGDGVRCAGGQLVRLGTATNSAAGASQYPSGAQLPISARGGVTGVGTRTYQAWYRNVAPFCTPAPFNTTNGWEIFWGA